MTRRTVSLPPRAPRALLLASMLAGTAVLAMPAAADYRVVADHFIATYPAACEGAAVTTGLCLLGATRPAATGDFLVSIPTVGPAVGDDIPVPLNTNIALAPGQYQLYQQSGLDRYHPHYFRVVEGEITTIQTATIKFQNRAGRWLKLQHWQAKSGVDGAGCEAEIGNTGVHALLPGLYEASLSPVLEEAEPRCERTAVAFHAAPGQGTTLRQSSLRESALTPANSYRYRSGGTALTTVNPQRYSVTALGFLPVFQSFQGIHYPGSGRVSGLVMSAAPGFTFVFPLKLGTGTECGVSIAAGGLPARLLLTDCQFDAAGTLTGFRVNAGTFFGLDNTHAKTGMAGHAINSAFLVRNASFNLQGN
jgi:hypothetical protein